MQTNNKQQEWEKKLSAAGFAVDGIDLTDAAVMTELWKTLRVSYRQRLRHPREGPCRCQN